MNADEEDVPVVRGRNGGLHPVEGRREGRPDLHEQQKDGGIMAADVETIAGVVKRETYKKIHERRRRNWRNEQRRFSRV